MRFLALLTAATLAAALGGPSIASAAESDGLDAEVASNAALADAVESAAEIPVDLGAADVIDASVAEVEVVVPNDPADPLQVGAEAGASFDITLPALHDLGEAEVIDGTVAYQSADASIVPVVREDGTLQVLAVLESAEAPKSYPYEFGLDGGRIEPLADGGFVLLDRRGDEVGRATAPWAIDADGRAVPTRYEITGTTVSQIVEPDPDAAYPIAADPAITVTTYEYKVTGVSTSTKPNYQKPVGGCVVGTANTVCTISASYSEKASVSGSLGLSAGQVSAQLGFALEATVSGSMSCTSPPLPKGASYRAYITGTYYSYKVEKWKVVKAGGQTARTLVERTGSQTAFRPSRTIFCTRG